MIFRQFIHCSWIVKIGFMTVTYLFGIIVLFALCVPRGFAHIRDSPVDKVGTTVSTIWLKTLAESLGISETRLTIFTTLSSLLLLLLRHRNANPLISLTWVQLLPGIISILPLNDPSPLLAYGLVPAIPIAPLLDARTDEGQGTWQSWGWCQTLWICPSYQKMKRRW